VTERPGTDYVRREAGILLHVTSLPGPHGIGDLGSGAYRFVDFLQAAGQRLWQILPLTPLGHGNSPYASPSAMAGNPLMISLEGLAEDGLLSREDLATEHGFSAERVDYGAVTGFKMDRLRRAHGRFRNDPHHGQRGEYERFLQAERDWLEDYALFMAIKESRDGGSRLDWDQDLVRRRPEALEEARSSLLGDVDFHSFVQFEFSRQWSAMKQYANSRGVRIMGDIPIFVALDSADVWAYQDRFHLDERGRPTVVAGVPPDYFSPTGQRWGNPLYRWHVMAQKSYPWWIRRFRIALSHVDIVRIDHFRGFQAYWEIPAANETAEKGRWVEGPGTAFFKAMEDALGQVPVVAEDLGLITPEVEALRLELGYPGMKVLHFAFDDGAKNPYLPHNYERRCVAYTGTHDNDTTVGWFGSRSPEEQARVRRYLGDTREIHWDLMRLLYNSVADVAIAPLQDVLGLGTEARMNMPGQPDGNWGWRVRPEQLAPEAAARLKEMVTVYGRALGDGR
jgi:4-alpha-glucanotransferase